MDDFLNNNTPQHEDNTLPQTPESENVVEPPIIEDTTPTIDMEQQNAVETDFAQTEPLNNEPEVFEEAEVDADTNDTPVYNPVHFSPVEPIDDYKPMSKGLKVFSIIIALIILLTGTTLAGYYAGKNSTSATFSGKTYKVDLAAKPKNTDEMTAAEVYKKVDPSIVGITIYNTSGAGGQASGIVFSKDGYIITNDHIYSSVPNAKFKIHTYDGTEYDAKYIAGDLISDLAVLKIDNCKLTAAEFGNSDELYYGQNVAAIGRPNDATDTSSITSGIVSALNRRVSNSSNYPARLIQTSSPINPGSSGGALVNMYGQVIGVTSSKVASVDFEGVGYAIPTTVMKRVVSELISDGKVVSRAKLGITYTSVNSVIAELNGYKHTGLLVDSVASDSDLYNVIGKGDLITKINDIPITNDDEVLDIIEQCSAGDTITVTVVTTKNATKTFKAELKANIGESSYSTKEASNNNNSNSSNSQGGTFDFPFGE